MNMCGLFGVLFYGKKADKSITRLVEKLGHGAAQRGAHATGISYVNSKKEMVIDKAAVSAYRFTGFDKIPLSARLIMGHTRHTTQGSEKKNYNNHPFLGTPNKKEIFTLAHNGVLDNDGELQRTLNFPKTQIETDSYVAVQLIESKGKLDIETVKYMAEQVEGMFTFTIADLKNNLYIVKNDSPMNIVHFPKLEMYVYASTADILHEAIMSYSITREVMMNVLRGVNPAKEEMVYFDPKAGDIVLIKANGTLSISNFNPQERYSKYQNRWARQQASGGVDSGWDDYDYRLGSQFSGRGTSTTFNQTPLLNSGTGNSSNGLLKKEQEDWYTEYLKHYAHAVGHEASDIENLRTKGFSYDEIEEALYQDTVKNLLSFNPSTTV
jgi:glucosamine--fructose-6-phosphate aminotransferase (isomerizing)